MVPDRHQPQPLQPRARLLLLSAALRRALPLLLCGWLASARADTVYLAPDRFIADAIGADAQPQALWLTRDVQAQIVQTLGHPYPLARLRYWRSDRGIALVLDEIGKEFPITAGFVVRQGHIVSARVLIYRESRGQEISQPAFLRQFQGLGLTPERQLDKDIDGITGATMSVDAMQRMARTALTLAGRIESSVSP